MTGTRLKPGDYFLRFFEGGSFDGGLEDISYIGLMSTDKGAKHIGNRDPSSIGTYSIPDLRFCKKISPEELTFYIVQGEFRFDGQF